MKIYFSIKSNIIIKIELNNILKIVKYYYTSISTIIFLFQNQRISRKLSDYWFSTLNSELFVCDVIFLGGQKLMVVLLYVMKLCNLILSY